MIQFVAKEPDYQNPAGVPRWLVPQKNSSTKFERMNRRRCSPRTDIWRQAASLEELYSSEQVQGMMKSSNLRGQATQSKRSRSIFFDASLGCWSGCFAVQKCLPWNLTFFFLRFVGLVFYR